MFSRRKFRGKLKCLLHFDYPYYAEPGDGCRDELGLETWSRVGGTKFVGTETPVDASVAGTPLFGYRCPQFAAAADFVKGMNATGIWNLASGGDYEIELFVRPTSAAAGNIFALLNGSTEVFALAKNASNMLTLVSSAFGINKTATTALTLNAWNHVMIRLSSGTARVYLNGTELFNQAVTAGQTLAVTEARIGGFAGQADEFAFRHSARAGNPVVPTEPYQGSVNIRSLGGFGSGSHGDVTITAANAQINSYAMITGAPDARTIQAGAWANGIYGAPAAGDEIMLHVSLKRGADESRLGFYAFRRIAEITETKITLDAPVSEEFTLGSSLVSNYYVQAVTVPNYNNLTVEAAATIVPRAWDTASGGGIIAFRCSGRCAVNGRILTAGSGPERNDTVQLTHAEILDRFILTGNVFITAAELLASNNARIGGNADGSRKGGDGGDGGLGTSPSPGATHSRPGADGGVGGAGDGGGATVYGVINTNPTAMWTKGGDAGRPGVGEDNNVKKGGSAGANIIIVVKRGSISDKAVSSGGGGGCGGSGWPNYGPFGGTNNSQGGNGEDGDDGVDGKSSGYIGYKGLGGDAGGAGYGGGGGGGAGQAGGMGGEGGYGGGGTGFAFVACEEFIGEEAA